MKAGSEDESEQEVGNSYMDVRSEGGEEKYGGGMWRDTCG